jgi:F-type H+-transporting ATPase subunit alpha
MASEAGVLERLDNRVARYRFGLRLGEQGRVASVGDGIAWVMACLPRAEEILRFEDGSRGLVFDLKRSAWGYPPGPGREGDLRLARFAYRRAA